jgi:hypothetical protein
MTPTGNGFVYSPKVQQPSRRQAVAGHLKRPVHLPKRPPTTTLLVVRIEAVRLARGTNDPVRSRVGPLWIEGAPLRVCRRAPTGWPTWPPIRTVQAGVGRIMP